MIPAKFRGSFAIAQDDRALWVKEGKEMAIR